MLSDFRTFSEQNWKLSTALLIPLAIEKQLSEKIEKLLSEKGLSEGQKKDYFIALTFPEKESFSTKELISFYNLASSIKIKEWNRDNISRALAGSGAKKKLRKYLRDFGWIGARWYIGDGWNKSDVANRLSSQNPRENFRKKAEDLGNLIRENKKKTEKIIKHLNLCREEVDLIKTAKEYVFIRTFRTDIFNKAGFIARPFLKEIAKRLGVSFGELIFLSAKEIDGGLEKKLEPVVVPKIKERQRAFGALLYGDRVAIFEGREIDNFRKEQNIAEVEDSKMPSDGLKGMIASPGKVRGIVRVIADKKELNKVGNGDILVASMTTPDFVPAMERAAAFITDEGGITCHAAIVSREMQKPCIIGTKIATKVLKDGDLVEVDAERGVVRILNKK